MILCDGCEEWFHGECIKITRKESKNIEKYFCDVCRREKSLEIQYKDVSKIAIKKPPKPAKIPKPPKPAKVPKKHEAPKATRGRKPATTTSRAPTKNSRQSAPRGVQCGNPPCQKAAVNDSIYCSNDCGMAFNKLRYEKLFVPRALELISKPSLAKVQRLKYWNQLGNTQEELKKQIRDLKVERDELKKTIDLIKADAKDQARSTSKDEESKNDSSSSDGESEEATTGDATKLDCISCGHQILMSNTYQHWSSCHKRTEALYNFTADIQITYMNHSPDDPDPRLYCLHQDKKTKRYCMNLESSCPLHSNWLADKDEICGCPLVYSPELKRDGNYCLELKKDCSLHYHWDKFRITLIDIKRLHAFSRYNEIEKLRLNVDASIENSYGGVIGIMLHQTKLVNTDQVA